MKLFLIFAALALPSFTPAQTLPTLPQATVSLAVPTQGGSACPTLTTGSNCIRTPASGSATDFQSAINAATCGDTIVLTAGSTYSGNFTIPSTACSGWIVIKSSALASLPASGNRVTPSNVANMPLISTPNTAAAIAFQDSSNHWRLMGLDITTSFVSTSNTVFYIVSSGGTTTTLGALPSFIIFDRCLVLGLSNSNSNHGIGFDGASMAVVDSYCDEIHSNGQDSQCIIGINGPGPFLIQNNFLQAAGENIMFGGGDPLITNLVPSDITIVGNDIEKNLVWNGQSAPLNWSVKNLFEIKNAQRLLLDGNVIQHTWVAGQSEAIIIRSANQSGACTWCASQDMTLTHNLINDAPAAMDIDPCDCTSPSLATTRVLVQNNLINNVHTVYRMNAINSSMPQMSNITIDHNDSFTATYLLQMGDSGTVSNLVFTNLLSDFGTSGVQATGINIGDMNSTLSTYTSSHTWNDVVLTNTSQGNWPVGTLWSTNLAGLGMTSVTGTDPNLSGNFKLTSGSAYHNAGTDGKDLGVWDWAVYNNDTANALSGVWAPLAAGTSSVSGITLSNGARIQ